MPCGCSSMSSAHPEGLFPTPGPGLLSIGPDVPSYTYLPPGAFVRSSSDLLAHQPAGVDREGLLAVNWTWVSGRGSLIKGEEEDVLGGLLAWPASLRGWWGVADTLSTA